MAAKAIDPEADCFTAGNNATLNKQIFHIGCAQRKPVIDPNCISEKIMRKAKPLQSGKKLGNFMPHQNLSHQGQTTW